MNLADDMDADGHRDILIAHGRWQNAGNLTSTAAWAFHPVRIKTDNGEKPLPSCANFEADDLDVDGDMDIFLSSAHSFGVWWAENACGDGWTVHEIDKSYLQMHALETVDINGDGQLDYVTGSRLFAHNGGHPGRT